MICWGRQDLVMGYDFSGTERRTVGYAGRNFLCGVACHVAGVYRYLLPQRIPVYREGDSLSPQELSVGGDRERRTERTEIGPGPLNGFFSVARPTFRNFRANGASRRYR